VLDNEPGRNSATILASSSTDAGVADKPQRHSETQQIPKLRHAGKIDKEADLRKRNLTFYGTGTIEQLFNQVDWKSYSIPGLFTGQDFQHE